MTSKVQSILSYIGILWLVAYFGGRDERDDLSRYHLKQGLGLLILAITVNVLLGIVLVIIPSLSLVASILGLVFLI